MGAGNWERQNLRSDKNCGRTAHAQNRVRVHAMHHVDISKVTLYFYGEEKMETSANTKQMCFCNLENDQHLYEPPPRMCIVG